jgi:hypothetical protein
MGVSSIFEGDPPPLDWRSAQWLPVYLIGMGLISWNGQFSGGATLAPLNTGRIPFWVDIPTVAGFALIIYVWAYFTSLPKAEMLAIIGDQATTESGATLPEI